MEHLKFAEAVSTEDLKKVFDPEYSKMLNCSLAEHVLRLLAIELKERGEAWNGVAYDAFIGPSECEHGRSTSGYCGQCEDISEQG